MVDLFLNPEMIARSGWILAFGTPVLAALLLLAFWRRAPALIRNGFFWALVVSGPLLVALWWLFNAIEDTFGLDSVLALVINVVLFCMIGLLVGLVLMATHRKAAPRRPNGQGKR